MSGAHGVVGGEVGGTGTGGPLQVTFTYTGVCEISFEDPLVPLADLNPGAIRHIRGEENPLGQWNAAPVNRNNTIPRTIDICEAGIFCIPCIRTEFSNTTAFKNYLSSWVDSVDAHTDNAPLWWEIGNEPAIGPDTATIRANYLARVVAASEVLEARGKKLILTAFTNAAGGTAAALDDILDEVSGVHHSMIHAMAVHCYAQQAVDQPPGTPFNNTSVHDGVFGYRNLFNSYDPEFKDKPIFVTETGWPSTYRANGTNPGGSGPSQNVGGDWAPGQSGHSNGSTSQENRIITLAQQAGFVSGVFNTLTASRQALNLGAVCWFAHHDYGQPNGTWDRHCGLMDRADAKRSSYNTLKNYQRVFSIGSGGGSGNIVPNGGPGGFTHADLVQNYEFKSLPADWYVEDSPTAGGTYGPQGNTGYKESLVTFDATGTGTMTFEWNTSDCTVSGGSTQTYSGVRMHTFPDFSFLYGYIEARMRLSTANLWNAVWTNADDNVSPTDRWPQFGEIDIMETLESGRTHPVPHLHRTATEGTAGGNTQWAGAEATITTSAASFHTYAMHWQSNRIRFYYDGVLLDTYTTADGWIPSTAHHVILSLQGAVDNSVTSGTYTSEVDYVRVWQ